jgi:hypothetical protein
MPTTCPSRMAATVFGANRRLMGRFVRVFSTTG